MEADSDADADAHTRTHTHTHTCAAHGRTSSAAEKSSDSRGTHSVRKEGVTGVVGGNPPSRRERRSGND
eukprot:802798-Alexandrium_andersonii.AAC.1